MQTDAVITVLIVAIVANLVIMALLVLNLWARRRNAPPESAAALGGQSGGGEVGQMPDATRLERAIAGDRAETYGRAENPAVVPPAPGAPGASAAAAQAVAPEPVEAAPPTSGPSMQAATAPAAATMPPAAQPAVAAAAGSGMAPELPLPEAPGFELEPPGDLLRDPVTGLESAYAWERHLREEAGRLRRYGRPFAIVYAELDGLDRLAERVGTEAAGRIVPAIGQVLQRQARAVDIVARVGPARFAIMLPETDEVRAINYVERVRAACDVWLQAGAVALQLSFGWASPGPEGDTRTAQLRADERLQGELATVRRRVGAA